MNSSALTNKQKTGNISSSDLDNDSISKKQKKMTENLPSIPVLKKNNKTVLTFGVAYYHCVKEAVFQVPYTPFTPQNIPEALKQPDSSSESFHVCEQCKDCYRFASTLEEHKTRRSWILGYWCQPCFAVKCQHVTDDKTSCNNCLMFQCNKRAYLRSKGMKKHQKLGSVQLFYNQCQFFAHLKSHNITSVEINEIMLMPFPLDVKKEDHAKLALACKAVMEHGFLNRLHIMEFLKEQKVQGNWWDPTDLADSDSKISRIIRSYREDDFDLSRKKTPPNKIVTTANKVSSPPKLNTPPPKVTTSSNPSNQTNPFSVTNSLSVKYFNSPYRPPADIAFVDCGPSHTSFKSNQLLCQSKSSDSSRELEMFTKSKNSSGNQSSKISNQSSSISTSSSSSNKIYTVSSSNTTTSTGPKISVKKFASEPLEKWGQLPGNSEKPNRPQPTNKNTKILTVHSEKCLDLSSIISQLPSDVIKSKKIVFIEQNSNQVQYLKNTQGNKISSPINSGPTLSANCVKVVPQRKILPQEQDKNRPIPILASSVNRTYQNVLHTNYPTGMKNLTVSTANNSQGIKLQKINSYDGRLFFQSGKKFLIQQKNTIKSTSVPASSVLKPTPPGGNKTPIDMLENRTLLETYGNRDTIKMQNTIKTFGNKNTKESFGDRNKIETVKGRSQTVTPGATKAGNYTVIKAVPSGKIIAKGVPVISNLVSPLTPSTSPSELSSSSSCDAHAKPVINIEDGIQKNSDNVSLTKFSLRNLTASDEKLLTLKVITPSRVFLSKSTNFDNPNLKKATFFKYTQNLMDTLPFLSDDEIMQRIEHVQKLIKDYTQVMLVTSDIVTEKFERLLRMMKSSIEERKSQKTQKNDDKSENRMGSEIVEELDDRWEEKEMEMCPVCKRKKKPDSYIPGFSQLSNKESFYCQCYNCHCSTCDTFQGNNRRFEAHINYHKQIIPYTCPECFKKFSTFESLDKHIWITCFHPLVRNFLFGCKICSIDGITSREAITNHFAIMHSRRGFVCDHCLQILLSKKLWREHQKECNCRRNQQEEDSSEPFEVVMCQIGNCVVLKKNFMEHVMYHFGVLKQMFYKCPFCSFSKRDSPNVKELFRDHVISHHSHLLTQYTHVKTLHLVGELRKLKNTEEVLPMIINTRTIAQEVFDKGTQDEDIQGTGESSLKMPMIVDVRSEANLNSTSTGANSVPKILEVKSIANDSLLRKPQNLESRKRKANNVIEISLAPKKISGISVTNRKNGNSENIVDLEANSEKEDKNLEKSFKDSVAKYENNKKVAQENEDVEVISEKIVNIGEDRNKKCEIGGKVAVNEDHQEVEVISENITNVSEDRNKKIEIRNVAVNENHQEIKVIGEDLDKVRKPIEVIKNKNIEIILEEDEDIEVIGRKNEETEIVGPDDKNIKVTDIKNKNIEIGVTENEDIEVIVIKNTNIEITGSKNEEIEVMNRKNENMEISEQKNEEIEAIKRKNEDMEITDKKNEAIEIISRKNEDMEISLNNKVDIEVIVKKNEDMEIADKKNEEIEAIDRNNENVEISLNKKVDIEVIAKKNEDMEVDGKDNRNIEITDRKTEDITVMDRKDENIEIAVKKNEEIEAIEINNEDMEISLKKKEDMEVISRNNEEMEIIVTENKSIEVIGSGNKDVRITERKSEDMEIIAKENEDNEHIDENSQLITEDTEIIFEDIENKLKDDEVVHNIIKDTRKVDEDSMKEILPAENETELMKNSEEIKKKEPNDLNEDTVCIQESNEDKITEVINQNSNDLNEDIEVIAKESEEKNSENVIQDDNNIKDMDKSKKDMNEDITSVIEDYNNLDGIGKNCEDIDTNCENIKGVDEDNKETNKNTESRTEDNDNEDIHKTNEDIIPNIEGLIEDNNESEAIDENLNENTESTNNDNDLSEDMEGVDKCSEVIEDKDKRHDVIEVNEKEIEDIDEDIQDTDKNIEATDRDIEVLDTDNKNISEEIEVSKTNDEEMKDSNEDDDVNKEKENTNKDNDNEDLNKNTKDVEKNNEVNISAKNVFSNKEDANKNIENMEEDNQIHENINEDKEETDIENEGINKNNEAISEVGEEINKDTESTEVINEDIEAINEDINDFEDMNKEKEDISNYKEVIEDHDLVCIKINVVKNDDTVSVEANIEAINELKDAKNKENISSINTYEYLEKNHQSPIASDSLNKSKSWNEDSESSNQNCEVSNESNESWNKNSELLNKNNEPLIESSEILIENNETLSENSEPLIEDNELLIGNTEPLIEINKNLNEDNVLLIENNEPLIENMQLLMKNIVIKSNENIESLEIDNDDITTIGEENLSNDSFYGFPTDERIVQESEINSDEEINALDDLKAKMNRSFANFSKTTTTTFLRSPPKLRSISKSMENSLKNTVNISKNTEIISKDIENCSKTKLKMKGRHRRTRSENWRVESRNNLTEINQVEKLKENLISHEKIKVELTPPPPLARIPQHVLRSQPVIESTKRVKKRKRVSRIAFNGPSNYEEDVLDFKCHVCGKMVDSSWPVLKAHFDIWHLNEYTVSSLSPSLLKITPDYIEGGYKEVLSKRYKCDSSPRKRKKRTRFSIKSPDKLSVDKSAGICVTAEPVKEDDGMFKCKKCEAKYSDMDILRQHISKSHRIKGRYLVCLECGENFVVAPSLQMHLKAFHAIDDPLTYLLQNTAFAPENLEDTEEEEEEVTTEANQCYVCMAVFEDKAAVDKHLRVHGMAFLNRKRIEAKKQLNSSEKRFKQSAPTEDTQNPNSSRSCNLDKVRDEAQIKINQVADNSI